MSSITDGTCGIAKKVGHPVLPSGMFLSVDKQQVNIAQHPTWVGPMVGMWTSYSMIGGLWYNSDANRCGLVLLAAGSLSHMQPQCT